MKKDWLKLSRNNIYGIIFYYVVLLIIGFGLTLTTMLNETFCIIDNTKITLLALLAGFGTALLGSTMYYLRKIYKSCINAEMESPNTEEDKIRQIGVLSYYYLRPLFAIIFSLIFHIALKESVNLVALEETSLSYSFIYLMAFLSFFAGFASGDLITYFEAKSAEISKRAFPK